MHTVCVETTVTLPARVLGTWEVLVRYAVSVTVIRVLEVRMTSEVLVTYAVSVVVTRVRVVRVISVVLYCVRVVVERTTCVHSPVFKSVGNLVRLSLEQDSVTVENLFDA